MKIVIDTNILAADYRMTGSAFRVFLEGLPRIGAKCCIPQVVLDEIQANHRRSVYETAEKILRASRSWTRLTGKTLAVSLPENELVATGEEYRGFLLKRFREEDQASLDELGNAHQRTR